MNTPNHQFVLQDCPLTIVVSFETPTILYKLIVCNIVCQLLSYKANYMYLACTGYKLSKCYSIPSDTNSGQRVNCHLCHRSFMNDTTRPVSGDNSPFIKVTLLMNIHTFFFF